MKGLAKLVLRGCLLASKKWSGDDAGTFDMDFGRRSDGRRTCGRKFILRATDDPCRLDHSGRGIEILDDAKARGISRPRQDLQCRMNAIPGDRADLAKHIKLVEVGFAVSEDALRQGRVDAVNMNQPFAARAEAKGGTRKLFSLSEEMPNIVHILEACRADFVDKNPDLVKAYVRDITSGMKKALANREETLKVVSEVLKAPVPVLDTYLLKDNDFGRDPGAAPNFDAIQKMLDIYAATGMLPKMDVAQFKHPTIVAPLQ